MGVEQFCLSDYELTTAKKQTKLEKFLAEMLMVVLCQALIALIELHYPKTSMNGGRHLYPFATMLLIPLPPQWKSLRDRGMEEA